MYWVTDEDTGKRIALLLEAANQTLIDDVIAAAPAKVVTLDKWFDGNDALKSNTVLQMKDAGIVFECVRQPEKLHPPSFPRPTCRHSPRRRESWSDCGGRWGSLKTPNLFFRLPLRNKYPVPPKDSRLRGNGGRGKYQGQPERPSEKGKIMELKFEELATKPMP